MGKHSLTTRHTPRVSVLASAVGLCAALLVSATVYVSGAGIDEDSPAFNCHIHGNRVCGPTTEGN